MMRGYAETGDCRRHFLLGYFGEDLARLCVSVTNIRSGVSGAGAIHLADDPGKLVSMPTVTADDIRKLARSEHDEVLAVIDGEVHLVTRDAIGHGHVLYTREKLIDEAGVDLTDMEAETLAAGLTSVAEGL